MRKKVISYEEVKVSETTKKKCKEYLENNPITMYWDYRDKLSLEQIDKLMKDGFFDLQDELYELNSDYIYDLECKLLQEMQEEFPELAEIELSDLREEFMDYVSVDLNLKSMIKNTPDVRVRVVINTNYDGVGYQYRGNGDFKGHGYISDIKKLLRGKYDKQSFQQELDNIMSSCNQFIFYFKTDVESLNGIKEKFKNKITIPKEAWAGFYDSFNGSGSVLEVKLLKDITLKKQYGKTKYDTIDIVLDECNKDYSVEKTYGLCNVPEIKLKVK